MRCLSAEALRAVPTKWVENHSLSLIFEDNGHFADEVHKDPFIGLPASQGSQSS